MKDIYKKNNITIIFIGLLIILIGVLWNEWTITVLFSPDGIISSLIYRLVIWGFDLLCILIGVLLIKYNKRPVSKILVMFGFKLICIVVLVVLSLELILRLTISLWPREIRNLILSKYTYAADGIYFHDPRWNIHIMKPNFRQEKMFYNDHWWYHKINSIGIRDSRNIDKADIIVLGDSMIYGPGVNIENTLCYYLEKSSGLKVANLGVQGDYPPHQYIRLKHLGLFLKPKIVLFSINEQDEIDFLLNKPTEEYINKLISEAPPDYSRGIIASDYLDYYKERRFWWLQIIGSPYFYNFFSLRGIKFLKILTKIRNIQIHYEYQNIRNIMDKVLDGVKGLCESRGAKLIIVFHPSSKNFDYFYTMCKELCTEKNIPFLDLNKEFSKNQPPYFLKNDGHYSPQGSKRASDCIYKYLKNQNLF